MAKLSSSQKAEVLIEALPYIQRYDREITRRLVDAGALLGVAILDSLVWTRSGAHVSIREEAAELFVPRPGR